MRLSIIAASLLSAFVALPALAQEAPASPHTLTANATLASEYIYRGIGQSNRNPAIQGGADYSHSSGVYAGVWGSSISWLSDGKDNVSAPTEIDFYGGYKFEAGPIAFDFGLLQYYYPGSYPTGFVSPNTLEVYGAASYKFVSFKYSRSLTNLFGFEAVGDNGDTRETRGSQYFDLSANPEIMEGLTANLHIGRQKVAHIADASYTDWKVGLTKSFEGGWSISAAYIETDAKKEVYTNAFGKNLGDAAFIVTLGRSF